MIGPLVECNVQSEGCNEKKLFDPLWFSSEFHGIFQRDVDDDDL